MLSWGLLVLHVNDQPFLSVRPSVARSRNKASEHPWAIFCGSDIGVSAFLYNIVGIARDIWRVLGSLVLSLCGGPAIMFCPGRCRSGAVKHPLTPCSLMSMSVVLTHPNSLYCYSASALSKRRPVSRITNPGDAPASRSYVYRVTPPVGGSSQGGLTSTFISSLKYSPSLPFVHSTLRGGTYAAEGRGLLMGLVDVLSPRLTGSLR